MMKSYKYKVLTLGLALIGLASCSDSFLDKVPDERTEIDSEDKVIQLLVSAYPEASPAWLGELSSDNLIDNLCPHLPTDMDDKQVLSHYNYGSYSKWDDEAFRFEPATNATYSDMDSPGQLWSAYYGSIATVNQALAGIDRVAPDGNYSAKLKAAKGEALLIRAFDHFMLVNIFSQAYKNETASKQDVGVPYVTEIEDVVSKKYDRINVDSVYKMIGKDLEAGLSLISDVNFTTAPKYHFNTNAAHAFAARYYLYTRKYDKVIEHANAVLGTDSISMQRMIMDLSQFDGCSSVSDYANVWGKPELNGNLMLLNTSSTLARRAFGYRYSMAGPTARNVMMYSRNSMLWSGYPCPAMAVVSGQLLSSSSHDYGLFSAKAYEHFQYTNKVAGIGYVHIINRPFTSNRLLLERAEAEIMLGKYEDAENDLRWYWNCSIESMTAKDKKLYVDTKYTKYLTNAILKKYFTYAVDDEGKMLSSINPNCQENWDFTKNMSPDYVIPAEAVPYMNCVNAFRRYENAFDGVRFFDLKRWGMEYVHEVGTSSEKLVMKWNDSRRAIEVPWEALSAGMDTSRPEPESKASDSNESKLSVSKRCYVIK